MRKMFSIIAMAVLATSCVTTGWEKQDKDNTVTSCKLELSMFYRDPVPTLFCTCMVDKMEKAVPEFNKEEAQAWLNGAEGQKAGAECTKETNSKLK